MFHQQQQRRHQQQQRRHQQQQRRHQQQFVTNVLVETVKEHCA